MKFKVGDKIWGKFNRIDVPGKEYAGVVDSVCLGTQWCRHTNTGPHYNCSYPGLPCPIDGAAWCAEEKALRPRDEDGAKLSDGNQVVRWDQCPWQPQAIKDKEKAEASLKVDW